MPLRHMSTILVMCMVGLAAESGELLPPDRSPAEAPAVTVLQMDDLTRKAIALFDATPTSARHYDLVDCLDGLTFGFGNIPQSDLHGFMTRMAADRDGVTLRALASRMAEYFRTDEAAWTNFASRAQLSAGDRSDSAVLTGLQRTMLSPHFMQPYRRPFTNRAQSSTRCTPNNPPAGTRSFFDDHAIWFRPAARLALRDSDVVDFQVRDWRTKYLDRGVRSADGLGISGEPGSILLTFVMSNPGQIAQPARGHLVRGEAPVSFTIAGRSWRWDGADRPASLTQAPLERWRLLLIWQAMCDGRPRIRNRNIAFFRDYLAPHFTLPSMQGQLPRDVPSANCNPQSVRPAV